MSWCLQHAYIDTPHTASKFSQMANMSRSHTFAHKGAGDWPHHVNLANKMLWFSAMALGQYLVGNIVNIWKQGYQ